MRGKHSGTVFAPCITRITPAGAGKTKIKPTYRPDKTDHPRRCGENDTIISWTAKEIGSPPQVRGKLVCKVFNLLSIRITPAGAGKTGDNPTMPPVPEDHPRRCGENRPGQVVKLPFKGSPPQVRGKRYRERANGAINRITPAGAGKTVRVFFPSNVVKDHPRRCGENYKRGLHRERPQGSPPQVRGKLCDSSRFAVTPGITPAGAGKTCIGNGSLYTGWDHPRRCGENFARPPRASASRGSPPQVRGKPFDLLSIIRKDRITPAGAGKTLQFVTLNTVSRDHPRRCGENFYPQRSMPAITGSPPQVRGKPGLPIKLSALVRITPAGAGKTVFHRFLYADTEDHPRRCGENCERR